jgi:dTDP-4-dehydrorhamnose 3,5-epimerase-like enzyme
MIFTETTIPGVIELAGILCQTVVTDEFTRAGLDPRVARSTRLAALAAGTLRGLHLPRSSPPRVGSPTFCHRFATELNDECGRMLYIPEGCGHGYLTLVPNTDSRASSVGAVRAQERRRSAS